MTMPRQHIHIYTPLYWKMLTVHICIWFIEVYFCSLVWFHIFFYFFCFFSFVLYVFSFIQKSRIPSTNLMGWCWLITYILCDVYGIRNFSLANQFRKKEKKKMFSTTKSETQNRLNESFNMYAQVKICYFFVPLFVSLSTSCIFFRSHSLYLFLSFLKEIYKFMNALHSYVNVNRESCRLCIDS